MSETEWIDVGVAEGVPVGVPDIPVGDDEPANTDAPVEEWEDIDIPDDPIEVSGTVDPASLPPELTVPEKYLYNDDGTIAGINPAYATLSNAHTLSGARIAVKGASLGLANHLQGAVGAAHTLMPAGESALPDTRTWEQKKEDFWAMKGELVAEQKKDMDEFAEENPGEAFLWELAGGFMLPVGGGSKMAAKATDTAWQVGRKSAIVGSVQGAIYGAATAEPEDWVSGAIKFGLGGLGGGLVLGTLSRKIGNFMKHRAKVKKDKVAKKYVEKTELLFATQKAIRPDASDAEIIQMSERQMGGEFQEIRDYYTSLGMEYKVPSEADARLILAQAYELRNYIPPGFKGDVVKYAKSAQGLLDDIGGVMVTRIRNISPKLATAVDETDLRIAQKTNEYQARVKNFARLNKHQHRSVTMPLIKHELNNSRYDAAVAIAEATGDEKLVEGVRAAKGVLEDIAEDLRSVEYTIQADENYFVRAVKDVDHMREALGRTQKDMLDKAKENWAKRTGKRVDMMTEREEVVLLNRVLRAGTIGDQGGALGNTKARTIDYVSRELEQFYEDPVEALGKYIERAVQDVEERRMFNKYNATAELAEGVDDALDYEQSVGNLILQLMEDGDFPQGKFNEVQRLLSTRYGRGRVGPGEFVGAVKDVGLMSAIGNPQSASIQIADVGNSMVLNGVFNTVRAMVDGPLRKWNMRPRDIGVDQLIAHEFSSTRKTGKALGALLKGVRFLQIDQAFKGVFMNAKLIKDLKRASGDPRARQSLYEELLPGHGEANANAIIQALADGDFTNELLKLHVWQGITQVQPLSLSQSSHFFQAAENARVAWTLKSFAVMQANLWRTEFFQQLQKGTANSTADASIFAVKYALLSGGITHLVNEGRHAAFSLGSDPMELTVDDWTDGILWHMLAATVIVDKFNTEKFKRSGDVMEYMDAIAPPTGMFGAAIKDLSKALQGWGEDPIADAAVIEEFPGLGKFMNMMFGSGMQEEYDAYQKRRLED